MSKCGFEKVKRPFSQNRGDLKKHLGVREKTCYSFYANLLWFWNKPVMVLMQTCYCCGTNQLIFRC